MAERGRGRPSADPADLREQVVTTKLNKPEGKSWRKLLDAMAATGPKPRDADAVRWLMREECLRRGIPWAEDDSEQPQPRPYPTPPELQPLRVADPATQADPDPPERRFIEREPGANEAVPPAPAGKPKRSRR